MGSTETYNVQQHCMINMLFQEFVVKSDSASDIQTTQAQKLWHNERTDQDSDSAHSAWKDIWNPGPTKEWRISSVRQKNVQYRSLEMINSEKLIDNKSQLCRILTSKAALLCSKMK